MDAERWGVVQDLFHRASGLPTAEREAFLARTGAVDAELAAEVRALLTGDHAATLLDVGLASVASDVLRGAPAPREVGPYRILRAIGEGGMAVVYLAERADLGSRAAVKVLRDAWLSPARRERFAAEQRTLAQLEHPLIARLYDADILDDGTPWFAMEYVEGASITEHCARVRAPVTERLKLFRSACEAVAYAHRQAVVHRDLKPSNILVKRDGALRLLDFGIAKQIGPEPRDPTRTAFRLMTPAYAAPEQLRGERVGLYTDVYALGVVLHELLTGRRPYDRPGLSEAEREALVLGSDPERPSAMARRTQASGEPTVAIDRRAWADLDVLCLTALQRAAERRYASVEAMARDVDHFLDNEPLEARPDSLGYRAGKLLRRRRGAVAAAAAVAAVLLAVVTAFTVRLSATRDAALAQAKRAQRIQAFMIDLFQGGDAEQGPARDLTVLSVVERGALETAALDSEPEVQADLYATLGSILGRLGEYERSEDLLTRALDRQRALHGFAHPSVGESLGLLGRLREEQRRVDEAVQLTREGSELIERALPPQDPRVAKAAIRLGSALVRAGKYPEAVAVIERAIALEVAGRAPASELAASKALLSEAYFFLGQHDRAEALSQELLVVNRALHGENHPSVADALVNLGEIRAESSRWAEAEPYFREAVAVRQAFYGGQHVEAASAMTSLAQALTQQGKVEEGEQLLREALAILERGHGHDHPRVGFVLMELGNAARRRRALDEAEQFFRGAEQVYRKVYGKHYYIGAALTGRAEIASDRKKYPEAEALIRQALASLGETLPAQHERIGKARVSLGRVLSWQGRYREAEPELVAGYAILMKEPRPPVAWLRGAVEELTAAYRALGEPQRAAPFRDAFAALEKSSNGGH